MLSLLLDFPDLVFQKIDLIGKTFVLNLTIPLDVLDLKIFFLNLILQLSDVQLLKFGVSVLRSLQILNLIHGFVLKSILQSVDLNLLQILHLDLLILQFGYLKNLKRKVLPQSKACLLYTSPSPRDQRGSRMPSSA